MATITLEPFVSDDEDDAGMVCILVNGEDVERFTVGEALELIRALHDVIHDVTATKDDETLSPDDVPSDFEVTPLHPGDPQATATCGTCGLSWNDETITAYTPAPSARCPFEGFHA